MELLKGTVVDRYTVQRVLGAGAMGVVYLVEHNDLGSHFALKVVTVSAPSVRVRMLREAQLQANLHHPNVVSVANVVTVGQTLGIVMEYVDGPDLATVLAEQRLALAEVDALVRGILAGVAAAHDQGLVHRDLKPANVLLARTREGWVPKVADFGLAKPADESDPHVRTGTPFGTPCYMSPEQVRDAKRVDRRSDIWALGALLYEMLSGKIAFDGKDTFEVFQAITSGRYVPVQVRAPAVPKRMRDAVSGSLIVDVQRRIPDVASLLAVWTGERELAPPPRRWPYKALALALVLVLVLAAALPLGAASTLGAAWWVSAARAPEAPVAPVPAVPSPSRALTDEEQGQIRDAVAGSPDVQRCMAARTAPVRYRIEWGSEISAAFDADTDADTLACLQQARIDWPQIAAGAAARVVGELAPIAALPSPAPPPRPSLPSPRPETLPVVALRQFHVKLGSLPAGAEIEVDGVPSGRTPRVRVPIEEGQHEIRLRHADGSAKVLQLRVGEGLPNAACWDFEGDVGC